MIGMSTTERTGGRTTGGEPGLASRPRHVGHGAVMFAVRPLGHRTAAEVKIRVTRIPARPAAGLWGERVDRVGSGLARAGAGGCLGARRRRLDEERCGRLRFGAAIGPGGGRGGSLLDLANRHRPRGQEAKHDADPAGNAAVAVLPAADAARADAEQRCSAARCDAERAECRAKFARGRVNGHDEVMI
jgi:hypothetical protein